MYAGTIAPIVLRQYMYLRHLEDDDVYLLPYFGRRRLKDSAQPTMMRSSSSSSIRSSGSGGQIHDMSYYDQRGSEGNAEGRSLTSGDVDVVCTYRMALVDQLIEIMDSISVHMCTRTVFFAVAIFDRYLSLCEKPQETLFVEYELIGSTCLHIASKCEDVSYISVKDLAVASRNMYDLFINYNLRYMIFI